MPLVVALEMFTGHTEISIRLSIGQTEMSIGHSNVNSSIGQTEMSIGQTEMSIGHSMSIRPMDEWTLSDGKHLSFLSTGGYAQSYYVIIALLSDAVKVTCPLDIMKCPLDIQKCLFVHRTNRNVHRTFKCPFVHWTNRKVNWTFKCPFVQWTNGHCLMANTSASYRQGVMLNHITSL